jgi:GNAT superfamily N-acetyltransferase
MTHVSGLAKTDARSEHLPGLIRKLWPAEVHLFGDHLLRLDAGSRRMRFAHGVSDSFIEDYARRMGSPGNVTYGYIEDGKVRAAAELKQIGSLWSVEAEAAFSIEPHFQNRGLGTLLMGRLLRTARNRGIHHLALTCLAENERMQAVARKHEAGLKIEMGEVTGEITPHASNYFSILEEAVDDRVSLVFGFLDMQTRLRTIGLSAFGVAPAAPRSRSA